VTGEEAEGAGVVFVLVLVLILFLFLFLVLSTVAVAIVVDKFDERADLKKNRVQSKRGPKRGLTVRWGKGELGIWTPDCRTCKAISRWFEGGREGW
jgi:hypothetical protein